VSPFGISSRRQGGLLALSVVLGCDRQQERVQPSPPAPVATTAASAESAEGAPATGLAIRTGSVEGHPEWEFTELEPDPKRVRLEVVSRPGGAVLRELLPPGGLAVINGGYFDASYRPTTWVTSGGVELAPRNPTTKGGVLALAGEEVFIGPTAALPFEPELIVQSFPLIVEPGGRAGIRTDDGKRAARTVACLRGGALHFILLTAQNHEGPTLYESVAILREPAPRGFGCSAALNLDGGPSTGVWFGTAARSRLPLTPVAYGIAMLLR
jgi:hypothetical protein